MGFFTWVDESNLLFAGSNTACCLSHCGLCIFLEAFNFDLSQSTLSSVDDRVKKKPVMCIVSHRSSKSTSTEMQSEKPCSLKEACTFL